MCRYRKSQFAPQRSLCDARLSQALQIVPHLIGAFNVEEMLFSKLEREFWLRCHQILDRALRCLFIAEVTQCCDQVSPRPILRVWDLHRAARPDGGVLELAAEEMRERAIREEAPAEWVVRAELDRLLELLD